MKKFIGVVLIICLLGLCGCWEKDEEETTQAPTQAPTEAVTEAIPGSVQHSVAKRIHASLPEFTFTLYGDPSEDYEDWNSYHTLAITGGGFHQRLEGFDTESPFDAEDDFGLVFADFDNDGWLDVQLHQYPGGSMGNEPSLFWLWDSGLRRFVENAQLGDFSEDSGIHVEDDGRISSYTRAGYGEYLNRYYAYMDGEFVLVETQYATRETVGGQEFEIVEIHKLVDGGMSLTSTSRTLVED